MKTLLPLLLLFNVITVYSQIPTTDLHGEYKFVSGNLDNTAGAEPLVQSGSALAIVSDRAGGADRALSLNGDYLQRTTNTEGNYDLSVSFWIKTTTNDATKRVIIDQTERTTEAESSSQTGWYAYLKDGKVGVAGNFQWAKQVVNIVSGSVFEATGFTGYLSTNAVTNIADGNWHHVTITIFTNGGLRQGTAIRATYNVYVDNVFEATQNQTYTAPDHPWSVVKRFVNLAHPITIGNSKDGNSTNLFQETIDDVRFYSRTLSAGEVTDLFNEAGCASTTGVTALTQDITVELDAFGNASISTTDIDNGSFADCDDPFTLSLDRTAFTCDDLGFNVVTLTATETYGAQTVSAATATVTVTYVPEVLTQDVTIQLDASGNATITAADINNDSPATSICESPLTFSLDQTSFTCADIGANTVTLTADDGNGNTGTATATVTVEDVIAPTVIAQNVAVLVDDALGFVTITPAEVDNGSTDNCDTGSLIMTLSKTKFTCEDTGDNIVTLTVEDTQGNIATADATVTVTSAVNDEIITATNANVCPDGTSGSTISTGSSIVGFNYTLRNSDSNAIVDGPIAGTGSALDFTTGNLGETTTFNVFAEKALATTQSALDFDGVNDYVNLGTEDRGVTNQVTVAAWIKTTSSGTTQFIASKYDFVNGYYLFVDGDGKAGISGRDGSGAARLSGISTKSVNDGEWHYLVGSVNAVTGDWSIYVDGLLESTTNNGVGPTFVNTASLLLGLTSGLYFTGEIDQITIWDTALDAVAIQSNMNACLTGSETNIVGHFIFEDGSGTILTDQSSSALNGTLTNMDGATDWIQVVSPSCGDKVCDYQLSTEVTIGDAVAPTAIAQDITAQIDASTGEATITADMVDNGSTDNCTAALTKSLSKYIFSCEDAGDQIITLTITDESGNVSTAQSTVTITSPIADETVTTANTSFCPDGSIATISIGSSVVGIDYYLRDSENNAIKDGPIAGTGSALDLSTGNISSTTTFNVFAQNQVASTDIALDFDGSDDFVDVPVNATFDYANGYTFEAWVKGSLPGAAHLPMFSVGSGSLSDIEVYTQATTNSIVVVHDRGEATFGGYTYTVPPNNVWYHLAVTYDGTDIKVYYDGVEQGITNSSFAPAGALTKTAGLTMKIGKAANTAFGATGGHFLGQMDEIRVWNTAKSAAELLSDKNVCLEGTETDLEYYFKVDDNTGTTVTDLVNGSDGTMTNMDAGTDWITSGVQISCGSVCEFQMSTEITLGDLTNPTAATQDLTVQLDATGHVTIAASDINNASSDDCTTAENLTLSLDKDAFDIDDLGENTVTLTVADASGNTATETAIVTVTSIIEDRAVTTSSNTICPDTETTISLSDSQTELNYSLRDESNAIIDGPIEGTGSTIDFTTGSLSVPTTFNVFAESVAATDEAFDQAGIGYITIPSSSSLQLADNWTIEAWVNPAGTSLQIVESYDVNGGFVLRTNSTGTLQAFAMFSSTVFSSVSGSTVLPNGQWSHVAATFNETTNALKVYVNGVLENTNASATVDQRGSQVPVKLGARGDDNLISTAHSQDEVRIWNVERSAQEISDNRSSTLTGNEAGLVAYYDFNELASIGSGTTVEDKSSNGNNGSTVGSYTQSNIVAGALPTSTNTYGIQMVTTQTITPQDLVAPTAIAQDFLLILDQSNSGTITTSDIDNGSSDNCSDVTLALDISTFDDSNIGENTVTLTVTDAAGNASTATSVVTVTDKQSQTITFDIISDKTFGDADFSLTAATDSQLPITFSVVSGNISITGSDVTITGAGEATIRAAQAGDDTFAPAQQDRTFNIAKADQVLSITAIADKSTVANDFDISATADSGLGLTYTISGPATISGNTISLDGTVGTVTVTVSQAGDDNYNAVASDVSFEVVDLLDQTIAFDAVAEKVFGDPDFEITATVDSGLPVTFAVVSGGVTIAESSVGNTGGGSATFSIDGAGQAIIEASNDGDATYAPLLQTITIDIAKADQVITVEEVANKSVEAEPITIAASIDTGLAVEYSVTGPATISGNVVTLDGVVGLIEVTVSQGGTENYNPAVETISFETVEKSTQTISFSALSAVTYGASDITLAATSDSNLPVEFALIGGPATLSGNVLSITSSGAIVIEATQQGNVDYVAAIPVQQTLTVNKAPLDIVANDKTITFGDALPALTFSYTGFVNGEDETDLNASISISTTAGGEEGQANAGTYPISISVIPSEAGDNYLFNPQNATLTINKKDQVITVEAMEDKEPTDDPFDIVASVDSFLPLAYTVSGPAMLSGTTVTLDGGEGQVIVTVSQAGDVNHNAVSESVSFDVAVILAIGDEFGGVKIYPNPFVDHLIIESGEKVNIRFYTLNGKLIKVFSNVADQVNVQDLKAGTYLMEITTKDSKRFERIIKAN